MASLSVWFVANLPTSKVSLFYPTYQSVFTFCFIYQITVRRDTMNIIQEDFDTTSDE